VEENSDLRGQIKKNSGGRKPREMFIWAELENANLSQRARGFQKKCGLLKGDSSTCPLGQGKRHDIRKKNPTLQGLNKSDPKTASTVGSK